MTRVIAIDWSGAKSGASSKLWLAEVHKCRLVRLESGRGRREVISYLISEAARDPDLIVGLDFAFSFPEWYAKRLEAACVEGLWDTVREHGEEWLDRCREPFWGRPGRPRPDLDEHFRQTENEAAEFNYARPKSVFQIGGAGAVGTGSIRGMPYLPMLRENGFSIWPFHERKFPLLIEIYPRLLTGSVKKADFDERETYLASHCPEIDDTFARRAASSEDAFDAAVSAVVMSRHLNEIFTLAKSQDSIHLIEGKIWWPQNREAVSKSLQ